MRYIELSREDGATVWVRGDAILAIEYSDDRKCWMVTTNGAGLAYTDDCQVAQSIVDPSGLRPERAATSELWRS
jgi:hypothetical protein